METINRLTDMLIIMSNPTDRGKLFKIFKLRACLFSKKSDKRGFHRF